MEVALHIGYEENDIIQACIRKERWAQQVLYEQFYGKMMGVCLRYSNDENDALDILHEGFIKVFKNIDKYNTGTSLAAWIRKIMVNCAIDFYRKRIRRRTEGLENAYYIQSDNPGPISELSEKEILSVVQQLSPAYRTVFNLYVMEGYSHKEISEMLGISESTSRSNLVKARVKLKAILSSAVYGYKKE